MNRNQIGFVGRCNLLYLCRGAKWATTLILVVEEKALMLSMGLIGFVLRLYAGISKFAK